MNIKKLPFTQSLKPISLWLRKYGSFVVGIALLLNFGWLISRINTYNRREPEQAALDSKLQTLKKLKIDEDTVKKIKELQDNSQEVQSLFKQARENPFDE